MNNHFTIFSAGRDCAPLVRHNVASVIDQTYSNYSHIICVDDSLCGNGYTLNEALKYDKERTAVLGSVERKGKLWWMRHVTFTPDSIIVILDLDDCFYDRHVLERLSAAYQDPDVWLTYGQYIYTPHEDNYVRHMPRLGHCQDWDGTPPRRIPWIFSHLMTFRGFLWNKIMDEDLRGEDLRGEDGEYFTSAQDIALMWPMVEMAGHRRVRFIDRPMVRHTFHASPARVEDQKRNEATIRARKPYEELP